MRLHSSCLPSKVFGRNGLRDDFIHRFKVEVAYIEYEKEKYLNDPVEGPDYDAFM